MDINTNNNRHLPPHQPLQQQRKTSKGRQKIDIKRVEKESRRYVTFSKRKNGIFKKATELSTLCGAQVAVILFSEHGKVFSFGNPDVDNVIDQYMAEINEDIKVGGGDNLPKKSTDTGTDTTPDQEKEYRKSLAGFEEMKRDLQNLNKNDDNNGEFWWNLSIHNMEKDELECFKESLEELKKNVMLKIDELAASPIALAETECIEGQIDSWDLGLDFEYQDYYINNNIYY